MDVYRDNTKCYIGSSIKLVRRATHSLTRLFHELGDFVRWDGLLSGLVLVSQFSFGDCLEEVVRLVHPNGFLILHFLYTNLRRSELFLHFDLFLPIGPHQARDKVTLRQHLALSLMERVHTGLGHLEDLLPDHVQLLRTAQTAAQGEKWVSPSLHMVHNAQWALAIRVAALDLVLVPVEVQSLFERH